MKITKNSRILIIDDNKAIHEDFKKILNTTPKLTEAPIEKLKSLVFHEAKKTAHHISYEIDSAYQGKEGLALIKKAQEEGKPYAMAFVDILMPPGWDGVETIKHIWKSYPDIQIAICTAYADYSWEDITQEVGLTDNLLILKKPFDAIEIRQIACCLVKKWNLSQQVGHQYDKLQLLLEKQAQNTQELVSQMENVKEDKS